MNLTGYITKGVLGNWKGKDLGWRLHRTVGSYTVGPEYDTTHAVILTKRGKRNDQWAAGYWLGEGAIFRGETVGSAPHGSRAEAVIVDEAKIEAENQADYWSKRDEEAREEDERKMQEEEETYGRSPRRGRRRSSHRPSRKTAKFERCVRSVKRSRTSKRTNPWAVCRAAVGRSPRKDSSSQRGTFYIIREPLGYSAVLLNSRNHVVNAINGDEQDSEESVRRAAHAHWPHAREVKKRMGIPKARGRSPVRATGDETTADELLLYIDNDEPLYRQKKAFLENAYRKMKKGTYSPELAVKLWMYYVERGAKAYEKAFLNKGEWNKIFTKPTRELVARELAKREAAMLHHGEYASWGFPKLG